MLRIDTSGQEQSRSLQDLRAKLARLLIQRDGVQIDNAEDALVVTLDFNPVFQGAKIISDVKITGGLNAGEDSCFHIRTFMVPFRLPVEETLTIEKLVYGGEGLARQEGKVVLIPFVLPGERVRAETERSKNDLWRGRVIEILEPSPSRIAPSCPYFERCGGCQYQHMDYAVQLEQKRAILREVLQRVGKIEFAGEIGVISGEPWQYRNRVQLHVEDGKVGYFAQGSRELVAIDHCPIASPKLNETIAKIDTRPATTAIELFSNETDVQVNVIDRVPRPVLTSLASLGVSTPIDYD